MTDAAAAATPSADGQPDTVQTPVCIAFQLGWDMSRLYHVASIYRPYKYSGKDKLPSQRDFGGTLNTERRLTAVSAGLRRLADSFEQAHLRCPSLTPVLSCYTGAGSKEELREAIYRLHVEVLITIQAADPRLGSAYNLGRVLADTATPSEPDVQRTRFSHYRVQGLREELAQLASSFPPHVARGVSDSLCIWQCVLSASFGKGGDSGGGPGAALPRQAEIWRGVLSGERLGTDRLDLDDYVGAGQRLVDEARSISWGVVKSYRAALLTGVVIAVVGLLLAIAIGGTGSIIAGLAAAASALGVSWKGVASTLNALASHLRAPLWSAEMDLAVAHAITIAEARDAYAELPEARRRCRAGQLMESKAGV